MKKEFNTRRVISVSEIMDIKGKDKMTNKPIFRFDPLLKNWKLLNSLYETKIITVITKYESLSKEKFNSFMEVYTEIFEYILKKDNLSKIELTDFFHKISYFSFISPKSVKQFWNEWKNKRTLYP